MDDYAADFFDSWTPSYREAVVAGLSLGGYVAFALFGKRRATFKVLCSPTPVAGGHAGGSGGTKRLIAVAARRAGRSGR